MTRLFTVATCAALLVAAGSAEHDPRINLVASLRRLKDGFGYSPRHVLDVGANRGEWSDTVRSVFPDANFTMIEANRNWRSTLEGKGYADVIISLVGKSTRRVTYYSAATSHTGNSIYRERTSNFGKNSDVVEEKRTSRRVDDLLRGRRVDFVKMDIQGAELDALHGARNTLARADLLQLELSIFSYNKGAPLALEVVSFVRELGFEMFEPVELHHMKNLLLQIDFLFVRRESALWKQFDTALGLQDNNR